MTGGSIELYLDYVGIMDSKKSRLKTYFAPTYDS